MRPVRGMKDVLPSNHHEFDYVIELATKISKLYGFSRLSTPIVEYSDVFLRTLGETSDVVNKEVYIFEDRGGDKLVLRPEFTASVMRSVISNSLYSNIPIRLFSYGPLFRYDRPQAGRQRQFHQLNYEILGDMSPMTDAEIIVLASDLLSRLGILNNMNLEVNTIGCLESRLSYQNALKEYFSKYLNDLTEESKERLTKNPMRILDSKSESDKKICINAPKITNYLTKESREHFDQFLSLITDFGIKYVINERIVRGLDYYNHTVFEFVSNSDIAQSTVLAGGRYDKLANIMSSGKINMGAVGFACGIERILLLMNKHIDKTKYLSILPIGNDQIKMAYNLLNKLRINDIPSVIYTEGKISKRIDKSVKSNCNFAIFVGEEEIKTEIFKVKNLDDGSEESLSIPSIISKFSKI